MPKDAAADPPAAADPARAGAADPITTRALGRPGDLGWVVMAHGERYAAEFGWDTSFEGLVARIVADYAENAAPGRDNAWIAELHGQRVGCVFCVRGDTPEECKLRILLVDPAARGRALGERLVSEAIAFARTAGYARMRLWTNDPLTAARRIYLRLGFRLVAETPHRSFGADLVGETYELELAGSATPDDAAAVDRATHAATDADPIGPAQAQNS